MARAIELTKTSDICQRTVSNQFLQSQGRPYMSKTSAALNRLSNSGLPYISVSTDQTFGGVSASLAMLGDINIGEPKAIIGFAGRRVIEQTVRENLPEDFQRSEFLLEHGAIDMIVDRREMRGRVGGLMAKLTNATISIEA